jgi:hypothetical protein
MTCYNSELPIGPPGPTGPQGPQGPAGTIDVTDLPILDVAAPDDMLYIFDTSTNTSKQISVEDLQPYKVYSALITQGGTDVPVATVLQNTLGVTMTWSRVSEGVYKVTASSGIFLEAKTWTIINNINISGATYFDINRGSDTEVFVASSIYDAGTPPYVPADGIIAALSLEIRVYN